MAVAHHEGSGHRPFPPGPSAYVPVVEVARELDLLANGPVGRGPEVQLHGAEPVPPTGYRLAHGHLEAGEHGLLGGISADRVREPDHYWLAGPHRDTRSGEDRGRDHLGRRCRLEARRALCAEATRTAHPVVDRVGGGGQQMADGT